MNTSDFIAAQLLGGHPIMGDASPPSPSGPSVSITANGTVEITTGAASLTLTISSPAEFAGVYVVQGSDLEAGPVNLVPPQITGSAEVGQTLTVQPGLWAYDGANAEPTIDYVWQRSGVTISGQTALTYLVDAADEGADLAVIEQAVGTNGTRLEASSIVSVAGGQSDPIADLFASGEQGTVIDFDPSRGAAFQETSGASATTACGDGDPVGTFHDLVTGQYLTADNDNRRPIYRLDGSGRAYLDFSTSTVHQLRLNLDLSGTDRLTVLAAMDPGASTAFCYSIEHAKDASGQWSIRQRASQTGYAVGAGGTSAGFAFENGGYIDGTVAVVGLIADIGADSLTLRRDGADASTDNGLGSGNFASGLLTIGGRSDFTQSASNRLYGLFIRGEITEGSDLTALEAALDVSGSIS